MKIQFVWWGWDLPLHWGYWNFPRPKAAYYKAVKKPIFYGLCCGPFELRYFPKFS